MLEVEETGAALVGEVAGATELGDVTGAEFGAIVVAAGAAAEDPTGAA